MNAAILNADLPISLRIKRANRRRWMLDRKDNIQFLVEGLKAYRSHSAPLAWEGTFEQNRNQPAPFVSFADDSTSLMMEAFVLQQELEDLDTRNYPGIGNDRQRLQEAIQYLEDQSAVRDQEAQMMGLMKGKLIAVAEMAKERELEGYEGLPSKRDMQRSTFSKEDVIRQLAETLQLTAAQVVEYATTVPRLTPPPPTRARTPRRQSPPRSPLRSPTSVTVDSPETLSPSHRGGTGPAGAGTSAGLALAAIAEDLGIEPYGTALLQ